MSWRGPLAAGCFLAAEALLWYAALRSFATALERSAFREVASAIRYGIADGDFASPDRARDALRIAERAGEQAIGGPELPLIAAAAAGAFGLMRLMARADLPASSRAAAGVLASIAGVGLALQLALAGDAPWDGGILADIRGRGDGALSGPIDPAAFVADPDADRARGASRAVTIAGVALIWLRFLFAGRGPVTFERSLRSFGAGFAVAAAVALLSAASGAEAAAWLVLPYFVLGALSLAAAHAARAPEDETAARRDAPWVLAMLGTAGALGAIAAAFVLLSLLDAQRLLAPLGTALLTVAAWLMIVVLTPIFWAVEWLLGLVARDVDLANVRTEVEQAVLEPDGEQEGGRGLPGWTGSVLRAGLAAGALWVAWRAGRWLFARGQRGRTGEYDEVRRTEAGGAGLGAMLRSLLPRPRARRRDDGGWLARTRAYRLFGRMLAAARLRGLERQPGQTALEFGAAAGERLEAPPFAGIAGAFDGARYGRREPPPERLAALERAFAEWERAHPPPGEEPPADEARGGPRGGGGRA